MVGEKVACLVGLPEQARWERAGEGRENVGSGAVYAEEWTAVERVAASESGRGAAASWTLLVWLQP
jgi:hypothetical protein